MSYQTYQQERQRIERDLAFYQGFLKEGQEGTDGHAATVAMIARVKAQLDELNMSYYGTTVLF